MLSGKKEDLPLSARLYSLLTALIRVLAAEPMHRTCIATTALRLATAASWGLDARRRPYSVGLLLLLLRFARCCRAGPLLLLPLSFSRGGRLLRRGPSSAPRPSERRAPRQRAVRLDRRCGFAAACLLRVDAAHAGLLRALLSRPGARQQCRRRRRRRRPAAADKAREKATSRRS